MRSELARLLDGTEANAKRIESLQGTFPVVVLNEWRYATRHVVNLLEGDGDSTERRKAENHLARAYFDSCDMLLDCLLDRAREYDVAYSAYPEILTATVQNYPSVRKAIRDAHKAHAASQGFVDAEKRTRYAELERVIAPLDAAVAALDDASQDLAAACRRQRRKDAMTLAGIILAALGILATVLF